MINFLHHYLYQDLWQPIWPNWLAAVPITLYGRAKLIKWNRKRERTEHARHVDRMTELHRLHAKIDKVHEKLGISKGSIL